MSGCDSSGCYKTRSCYYHSALEDKMRIVYEVDSDAVMQCTMKCYPENHQVITFQAKTVAECKSKARNFFNGLEAGFHKAISKIVAEAV